MFQIGSLLPVSYSNGPVIKCGSRDAVNITMAEDWFKLYGVLIYVGSCKYHVFRPILIFKNSISKHPATITIRNLCSHSEDLKVTIAEIKNTIEARKSNPTQEKHGNLLHEFREAELNIRKWKAHILRSVNQESAKQNVLYVLDDTSVLIVMDWAMKFVQIKFEDKQSNVRQNRNVLAHK